MLNLPWMSAHAELKMYLKWITKKYSVYTLYFTMYILYIKFQKFIDWHFIFSIWIYLVFTVLFRYVSIHYKVI